MLWRKWNRNLLTGHRILWVRGECIWSDSGRIAQLPAKGWSFSRVLDIFLDTFLYGLTTFYARSLNFSILMSACYLTCKPLSSHPWKHQPTPKDTFPTSWIVPGTFEVIYAVNSALIPDLIIGLVTNVFYMLVTASSQGWGSKAFVNRDLYAYKMKGISLLWTEKWN